MVLQRTSVQSAGAVGIAVGFLELCPREQPVPQQLWHSRPRDIFKDDLQHTRYLFQSARQAHPEVWGDVSKEQNKQTNSGGARPDYVFRSMWEFVNDAPIKNLATSTPRRASLLP